MTNIQRLQQFALEKPSTSALSYSSFIGMSDELVGSNVAFLYAVSAELLGILQEGDTQLKNIALTPTDWRGVYDAATTLQSVLVEKNAEIDISLLRCVIPTLEKLINEYYQCKLLIIEEERRAVSKKLSEYEFLYACLKAANNLEELYSRFYKRDVPRWLELDQADLISPPAGENIISLSYKRQQRTCSEGFDKCFKAVTDSPWFSERAILGTPDCIAECYSNLSSLQRMAERNGRVLEAIRTFKQKLSHIFDSPAATVVSFYQPENRSLEL